MSPLRLTFVAVLVVVLGACALNPATKRPEPVLISTAMEESLGAEQHKLIEAEIGLENDPELTARTYRPGSYPADRTLRSGDFFRTDEERYLYFLGRRDDMIKSKGERISAKEVENTIHGMQGVAEVAVIGVPDEIFGQAIKAFLVLDPDTVLAERHVLKFCTAHLETYMVPKYVEFLDSLPKTPNGKIDKKLLRDEAGSR